MDLIDERHAHRNISNRVNAERTNDWNSTHMINFMQIDICTPLKYHFINIAGMLTDLSKPMDFHFSYFTCRLGGKCE